MSALAEWTVKCAGCGLRWIVYGGKPDDACAFCGGRLVKAKRRG